MNYYMAMWPDNLCVPQENRVLSFPFNWPYTFLAFLWPQWTPSWKKKNDQYPATPGTNKPYIYLKLYD